MKTHHLKLRKKTLFVFKSSQRVTDLLMSDPTNPPTTTTGTSTVLGL